MKCKTLEEFLAAIQHPVTVQALLIDPFNKTTSFVELPLQKERSPSWATDSSDSDEGDKDNTCLFIKREDVLEQLNYRAYLTSPLNIDGKQAMQVYMCEFVGKHPTWPGTVICDGQRTLIGRLLVTGIKNVRFGNRSGEIVCGFKEEHLDLLDIKWIGAEQAERKRRADYNARVKELEAAASLIEGEGAYKVIALD